MTSKLEQEVKAAHDAYRRYLDEMARENWAAADRARDFYRKTLSSYEKHSMRLFEQRLRDKRIAEREIQDQWRALPALTVRETERTAKLLLRVLQKWRMGQVHETAAGELCENLGARVAGVLGIEGDGEVSQMLFDKEFGASLTDNRELAF